MKIGKAYSCSPCTYLFAQTEYQKPRTQVDTYFLVDLSLPFFKVDIPHRSGAVEPASDSASAVRKFLSRLWISSHNGSTNFK